VFVLTHHAKDPVEMAGGTTFSFVTEGFAAAFEQAQAAAGDAEVSIAGGASTVRQALAAGVLDELVVDVAPVLLGAGERLFDGVADPGLTQLEVTSSPLATHIRYRIGEGGAATGGGATGSSDRRSPARSAPAHRPAP
jgi:dihydrofolate reductase